MRTFEEALAVIQESDDKDKPTCPDCKQSKYMRLIPPGQRANKDEKYQCKWCAHESKMER